MVSASFLKNMGKASIVAGIILFAVGYIYGEVS
jgi:hypothetical protein